METKTVLKWFYFVHVRYPLEIEISSANTAKSLEIVQKIKEFPTFVELKEKLLDKAK